MSLHRKIPPEHPGWDAEKTYLCRWCRKPVELPRRTFCGDFCVQQWKIRNQPGFARGLVFKRDKGACAECGRDCPALEARLLHLLYTDRPTLDRELGALGLTRAGYQDDFIDHRVPHHRPGTMGRPIDPTKQAWDPRRSLWECDHRVPVWEGGGSAGLDGLQTLCRWCHRAKTAEEAKRRARRRLQAPEDLFGAGSVYPFELRPAKVVCPFD
jgi:5-methylcytosine-specific restriction enzyme A